MSINPRSHHNSSAFGTLVDIVTKPNANSRREKFALSHACNAMPDPGATAVALTTRPPQKSPLEIPWHGATQIPIISLVVHTGSNLVFVCLAPCHGISSGSVFEGVLCMRVCGYGADLARVPLAALTACTMNLRMKIVR